MPHIPSTLEFYDQYVPTPQNVSPIYQSIDHDYDYPDCDNFRNEDCGPRAAVGNNDEAFELEGNPAYTRKGDNYSANESKTSTNCDPPQTVGDAAEVFELDRNPAYTRKEDDYPADNLETSTNSDAAEVFELEGNPAYTRKEST